MVVPLPHFLKSLIALFQSVTESGDGWCPSPAGRRLYQNIDLAQSPVRVIDII